MLPLEKGRSVQNAETSTFAELAVRISAIVTFLLKIRSCWMRKICSIASALRLLLVDATLFAQSARLVLVDLFDRRCQCALLGT